MKGIIEYAGIQICGICNELRECNYYFTPPDNGDCYICHECKLDSDKHYDEHQERLDKSILESINRYRELRDELISRKNGGTYVNSNWIGFQALINLIEYNELKERFKYMNLSDL